MWELEYAEKEYSIQSGIEKNRPLPDWFENEPLLLPGDEFYIGAFHNLGTCRQYGMTVGPIPWNIIVEYAALHELDNELTKGFVKIISEMDKAYLKRVEAKQS